VILVRPFVIRWFYAPKKQEIFNKDLLPKKCTPKIKYGKYQFEDIYIAVVGFFRLQLQRLDRNEA
jgi:hypothetical protein